MIRPLLKLRSVSLIAFSALALLNTPAHAELTIEITGAGGNRLPLAIADFGGDPGVSRALTSVIRGDLERSGLFKLIDTAIERAILKSSPLPKPDDSSLFERVLTIPYKPLDE